MKCPYCKSEELVWDYKNGAVVCTSCGCVADSIYVSQPCYSSDEGGSSRGARATEKLYRLERRSKKKLVEAKKRLELEKRGFVVAEDGRVMHIKSLAALKTLELNPGVRDRVEKGLRIIEAVKPSALSRTIRSRLALAYAVSTMIEGGRATLSELTALFSISRATAARLLHEAKQLL